MLEIIDVTTVLYFEVTCGKYQKDGIDTREDYG
jgi:hypothetical protein